MKNLGHIASDIPGRTDEIPTQVPSGSYVIPADIVSALGEGNTNAGAKIIEDILTSMKLRKAAGGSMSGFSKPKAPDVPVIVAGGEYIIDPETVSAIGKGNVDRGHRMLDEWVKKTRKELISTLKKLPPPAKD